MRGKLAVALFFCLAGFANLAQAKDTLVDVDLKWKPTTELDGFKSLDMGALPDKLKILPFTDKRKETAKVGENREKESEVLPVTTKSDVADFVTTNFKGVLRKVGVDLADSGGPYVLSGEIVDYFVTEKDTYVGNLTVRMRLTKDGKEVWKGNIIGTNTRFGRSYKYDNYMEVLSDTLIDFSEQLMKDIRFRKAIDTK